MSFEADNLLLISANWLGDAVMSLPALQAWQAAHPAARVTVLAKPGVAALWSLCPGVAAMRRLDPGLTGTWRAVAALRRAGHDAAIAIPNAFRAALIPWAAGIPRRRGAPRHGRALLLNDRVPLDDLAGRHQACEAYRLFGLEPPPDTPPPPRLCLPPGAADEARRLAGLAANDNTPLVAILPGAARGPSKRWPPAAFAAAARAAAAVQPGLRFVVCGSAGDAAACAAVAQDLGSRAANLAGRTSLPVLAALLARCRAVCCNDSGGMHLAAAAGARVVAVFGVTDPARTGPLGPGHRVLAPPGVAGNQTVARRSDAARQALAAVPAAAVAKALCEALREPAAP